MQKIKILYSKVIDSLSQFEIWTVIIWEKILESSGQLRKWTIKIYENPPAWFLQLRLWGQKKCFQISNSTLTNNIRKYIEKREFQNEYQEALSFQPDVVAVEEKTLPGAYRVTLYLLFSCIFFCFIWSVFASLDKIVVAQGKLVTCDRSMVVQPLETSVIRSIEVKAGDVVKKNQVLARLDPTISEATTEQIKSKLDFINALIKRLDAENKWSLNIIADYDEIILPQKKPSDYFSENKEFVSDKSLLMLQKRIIEQRENKFSSKIDSFLFDINFLNNNISGSVDRQEQIKKQIKVAGEIESMYYKMYKAKQGSKLTYLKAYENKTKIDSSLADEQKYEEQLSEKIKKAQSDRLVFVNTWNSGIVEKLFAVHQEKNGLTQSLVKASRYNELVQLKAARDAIVKEVADYSVGSVIKSAEAFFTLIPIDSELEAQVKIPAKDIAHIKVGSPVRIKIDAFPFQKHGTIQGIIRMVSPDAYFAREKILENGNSNVVVYYKTLIELTSIKLRSVQDDFRLIPGMTVRGEIKVGKRRVISYLFNPLIKGFDESLHEP